MILNFIKLSVTYAYPAFRFPNYVSSVLQSEIMGKIDTGLWLLHKRTRIAIIDLYRIKLL